MGTPIMPMPSTATVVDAGKKGGNGAEEFIALIA
jgi:hypothetical protein